MARWALVYRQVVVDLVEIDPGQRPYQSGLTASAWINVTEVKSISPDGSAVDVARGDSYDGATFRNGGT